MFGITFCNKKSIQNSVREVLNRIEKLDKRVRIDGDVTGNLATEKDDLEKQLSEMLKEKCPPVPKPSLNRSTPLFSPDNDLWGVGEDQDEDDWETENGWGSDDSVPVTPPPDDQVSTHAACTCQTKTDLKSTLFR